MTSQQVIERVLIKDNESQDLCSFEQCMDRNGIILLGNSGDGKSTLLKEMSTRETNAEFVSIKSFLTHAPIRWQGRVLYLDGLDEEQGISSAVREICRRIEDLGSPKFRLSCRAADWNADYFSLFRGISSSTLDIITLRIKGLTEEDISSYLLSLDIEPKAFLARAKKAGVADLLQNPLNLILIIGIVTTSGNWPSTKLELYEKAIEILISEENKTHRSKKNHSTKKLNELAEELCALQLLSNAAGFALEAGESTTSHPAFVNVVADPELARTVLGRRLFSSENGQIVSPYHRSIAEFLAAKYIVRRVKEGMPIGRFLAIISGFDGGIPSEFRGLGGWLSTLSPDFAEIFIQRDPLGSLIYGDVAAMSKDLKESLLRSLADAAISNPYFRSGYWEPDLFAPLATKSLANSLKSKLIDHAKSPALASCILDALSVGQKLPELKETISAILNDPQSTNIHPRALRALIRIGASNDELLNILNSINAGNLPDPNQELRGKLLFHLFPNTISEQRIAEYLVQRHQSYFGTYYRFLTKAAEITPDNRLPDLMDSITTRTYPRRYNDSLASLLGRILLRILKIQGESISANRLFIWLAKAQDSYGESHLDKDERLEIKKWLEDHQEKTWEIIDFWLSITTDEDIFSSYRLFMQSICNAEIKDFSRKIQQRIFLLCSKEKKIFMFERLIGFSLYQHKDDALSIEELFLIAEEDKELAEVLIRSSSQEIPPWRVEDSQNAKNAQLEEERDLVKTRNELASRMDRIESGEDIHALHFLSQYYLKDSQDIDHDHSPAKHIEKICSIENLPRIAKGFVASLRNPIKLPTPSESGELAIEKQSYISDWVILVGLNLLSEEGLEAIDSLPQSSIEAAAVCAITKGRSNSCKWVSHIIGKHTSTVVAAILDYLRPQLHQNLEVIDLSRIRHDEQFFPIRDSLVLEILSEFSSGHPNVVKMLLQVSIEERLKIESFLPAWRQGCANDPESTVYVTASEFLLETKDESSLRKILDTDPQKISRLREFLEDAIRSRPDLRQNVKLLESLCRILGAAFSYDNLNHQGYLGDQYDSAKLVQWMIEALAKQTSQAAIDALHNLVKESSLESWFDYLRFSSENQVRLVRDTRYAHPSMNDVAKTLSNLQPASIPDFHALITDHIKQIQKQIEHGPTDLKLAFWNLDGHGKAVDPRPENNGRDSILVILKQATKNLEISVEAEGNYADDKRADMKALFGSSMNIPIEIKRHYHPEVWSAAETQLIERYVIDPEASGYGIYIILWYGSAIQLPPNPPPGIQRPSNAFEMQNTLIGLIPPEHRLRISVVVIDCEPSKVSGKSRVKKPATKKPATKKPATKKPATKKPATKKAATKKAAN